jgi:DNA adenine methylase
LNSDFQPTPKPFLKWAGGKRALIPQITCLIPKFEGTYFEPFVGAGAILFSQSLQAPKTINDFNSELINVYATIQKDVEKLIDELQAFENTKECFLKVRARDREENFQTSSSVERAARFIFLNKTCFNGLYRVNSRGQFNVPYGQQKNPEIIGATNIRLVSNFLNGRDHLGKICGEPVKLMSGDYQSVLALAKPSDFIYLDPPYDPISRTSSFVSYGKNGFNREEQIRLRDQANILTNSKIPLLISNSSTEFIREIYGETGYFDIQEVAVKRMIGAKKQSRGNVSELLISNFKFLGMN